ncbi:hypothetical protein RD110_08860 [Rhodoferax koreense]|uniref:Response regulatory domain-containing protein n=1 Tax=Rhodoferax koreensis TaxID=1842727 RepID=A0A1P8JU43_9BURK|nr:hypothetical protein [Rhodoferax koreense]APW37289.1 hypothetical protein RD110_08860 [Rhodoferax koreense]
MRSKDELVSKLLKILTVFEAGSHRELVRHWCEALAPGSQVLDVASATDAVLTLLGEPVDLLLVDTGIAGDLLPSLRRHARRSAPKARLLMFGEAGDGVLPWSELAPTLQRLLPAA